MTLSGLNPLKRWMPNRKLARDCAMWTNMGQFAKEFLKWYNK